MPETREQDDAGNPGKLQVTHYSQLWTTRKEACQSLQLSVVYLQAEASIVFRILPTKYNKILWTACMIPLQQEPSGSLKAQQVRRTLIRNSAGFSTAGSSWQTCILCG